MQILKSTAALTIVFAAALCTHAETPFTLQPAQNAKQAPPLDNHGDPLPAGAIARLGTLRWRQKADGGPLIFSHDGKKLYSLDNAGNLYDWNVETGKIDGKLASQSAGPGYLALSPDGQRLAVATGKQVKVWDLVNGGDPRLLEGQGSRILAIDFAPDSRSLVSVAADEDVEFKDGKVIEHENPVRERLFVWDIDSRKVVAKLANQGTQLRAVVFGPDGKHVAIGNENGSLNFVHLESGKVLWNASAGGYFGDYSLLRSADGKMIWGRVLTSKRLVNSFDIKWGLKKWNIDSGKPQSTRVSVPEDAGKCDVATDGKHAFVTNRDALFVQDAESGGTVMKIASPGYALQHCAVSRDGKCLAAAGWDSCVFLWDLKTGKRLFDINLPDASACRVLPDNKTVLTLASDHAVHLWSSLNGNLVKSVPLKNSNTRGLYHKMFDLSPDGKSLALVGHIWDIAKGELNCSLGKPILGNVKYSPDGKYLAAFYTAYVSVKGASGGGGGKQPTPPERPYVGLFDSKTGKCLHQIHFTNNIRGSLAFTPDSKKLLVADEENLLIWEIPSANASLKLEGKQGHCHCFTPDASAFIESHGPAGYVLKSSTTGKVLRKLALHPAEQFEVIAPDGKTAIFRLSAAQASAISLRNLTNGKKLAVLDGQYGKVTSADFSPDGTHIVVGYSDSTALVWDIKATLRSQAAPAALKAQELDQLWKDLGSADEAVAITALDRLAATPEQALPLVKKHVSPLPKVNVDRLVADLDSDSFNTRDKASHELAKQEFAAAKAMRTALNGTPTLETRQRLLLLLKKLDEPITSPELLTSWRAVIVLEQIATPNAQKMLQSLANGAPEARLTDEALAALKRLPT